MGTIVQFAERLAEDGDWTPSERSQLRDMGAQLSEATAGLDLVFGKTEEGDPWCVVADHQNEVLLHVARIGGAFVVHSPRNDQMVEEYDLWQAVTRVLGGILKDRRGVVLPFPPEAMGQPAALALILAAAIRGDFRGLIQNALPSAPSPDDQVEATPMPQAPTDHGAAAQARHGAAGNDAADAQHHASNGQAAAQQAVQGGLSAAQASGPLDGRAQIQAAAGAESAPAARGAEIAQLPSKPVSPPPATAGGGGSGAGGGPAAPGQPTGGDKGELGTTTDGGSNDSGAGANNGVGAPGLGPSDSGSSHQVYVQADAVARGKSGSADVFMMSAPARADNANPVSLGTVADFAPHEGDRLAFTGGVNPTVVETTKLRPLTSAGQTGEKITYDTDGDGRPDAFVIVLDAQTELVLHKAANTAVVVEITVETPASTIDPVTVTTAGVFIGH